MGSGLSMYIHANAHDWGQMPMFEGKCPCLRAKSGKLSGHLPPDSDTTDNGKETTTANGSWPLRILVAKSKAPSQAACSMTRLKADVRVCSGASSRSQLINWMTFIAVATAT